MSREKQTYNPCDDCQHSYSKNNQESGMCKICEFAYFRDRKQSEGEWVRKDSFFVCSVCDTTKPFAVLNDNIHYYACNYCHKCGAKMKGGG